jgi:hypothetical protein
MRHLYCQSTVTNQFPKMRLIMQTGLAKNVACPDEGLPGSGKARETDSLREF